MNSEDRQLRRFETSDITLDDGAEGTEEPTSGPSWSRMIIGGRARVHNGNQYTYHQNFTDDGPAAKRQKIEHARQQSEALRKDFLDSLRYPDMFTRQESLRNTTAGTYQWVFPEQSPCAAVIVEAAAKDRETSMEFAAWSREDGDKAARFRNEAEDAATKDRDLRGRVVAWLREAESFFWIRGKPGSGKSMLMSFLLNNPLTKTNLQSWAGHSTVHVFSFFFWKPGSALQKTIPGLLRSLLWQLVRSKPAAVDDMLSRDSSLSFSAWHESRLIDTAERLLNAYQSDKILFLIDGLDECEDDHGELVEVLRRFGSGGNVKTLFSSRPEIALKRHIGTPPDLSLQDLNSRDISIHARQVFKPYGKALEDLSSRVVSHAKGVFLWAVLVCKSLVRGYNDGDDEMALCQRLETFPRGLEELFARMFSEIDGAHHRSLKFYLHTLDRHDIGTSLALVTAALHSHRVSSLENFVKLCGDEETRIVSQSRGLVELQTPSSNLPVAEDGFKRWAMKALSDGGISQNSVALDESQILQVRKWLSWVHRSAYEFIHGVSRTDNTFQMSELDQDHQNRKIWQGAVWLTQFLPIVGVRKRVSDEVLEMFHHDENIASLPISWTRGRSRAFTREVDRGLDTIHDAICSWMLAMQQHNSSDDLLMSTHRDQGTEQPAKPILGPIYWFWDRVFWSYPEYLAQNSDRFLQGPYDRYLLLGVAARLLLNWGSKVPEAPEREPPQTHLLAIAIQSIANNIHVKRNHDYHIKNSSLHLAEVNAAFGCRLFTWRGSGSDAPDERSTLSMYVFVLTYKLHQEYMLRSDMAKQLDIYGFIGETKARDVFRQILDLFDASSVSVGMLEHRTPNSRDTHKMEIQLPIRYWFSSLLPGSSDQNIEIVHPTSTGPVIRLCCMAFQKPYDKWRSVNQLDFQVFELSSDISEGLIRLLSQQAFRSPRSLMFVGTSTDFQSLTGTILNEIWEDPLDQLTAWGRLFCRACFRQCFKHYWRDEQGN